MRVKFVPLLSATPKALIIDPLKLLELLIVSVALVALVTVPEPLIDEIALEYPFRFIVPATAIAEAEGSELTAPAVIVPVEEIVVAPV